MLFARLERVPDPRATVERMLELTDLRERADDQVGTLSGGNRQRVNIAIGLLAEPEVLLLDEPSTALDPRQRERLWEFILRLAGEGTTVVYATHHIPEADRYANQLIVLADGERVFDGSPRELEQATARPASTSSAPSSSTCTSGATEVRWLLLKDLRILRRSPLMVALLVIYPIVIAVLIGFALSRGPDKPKVAFYNGLSVSASTIELGGHKLNLADEEGALFKDIDVVKANSPRRRDQEGARRRRAGRHRDPQGPRLQPPVDARVGQAAGLLQQRGPGQAGLRREHDRGAGQGRQRRR